MLDIQNLAVRIGKKDILKGINLTIEKGEFVGIVGGSGDGKTALLLSLARIIPYFVTGRVTGKIELDGECVTDKRPEEIAGEIGIVLENPTFQIFSSTVLNDVLFGLANLGVSYQEAIKRAEKILSTLGIHDLKDKNPREISGGQQQLLVLASILAMEPKVLVMDEPVSTLDPIGKSRLLSTFELLKKEGRIVIVTEAGSDIDQVMGYLDRLVIIKNGKIVENGNPRKLGFKLRKSVGIAPPQIYDLLSEIRSESRGTKVIFSTETKQIADTLGSMGEFRQDFKIRVSERKLSKGKEKLVSVENLHFTYPDGTKAIRGVNFDLYENEFAGIIGQNGSGKSTLSLILAGLYKPDNPDARVLIKGKDVREKKTDELRSSVGYVFQAPEDQLFEEKVEDEISFGLRQVGVPKNEIMKRMDSMLDLLKITHIKKMDEVNLTRGEKKLVAIASIAVMRPSLLIVDEPTAGLDSTEGRKVFEALNYMRKTQITPVTILHDMKLVAEYAQHILVMSDGKIVLDGAPQNIFYSKTTKLKKLSIAPPPIVEISQRLKSTIPVLTVDEFKKAFVFKGGKRYATYF